MDNLTRDAVAAFQAGMHYGDYMAKKERGLLEPKEVEAPVYGQQRRKLCVACGKLICGRRRKYCTDRCRQSMNNKRHYERKTAQGSKEPDEDGG